MIRQNNTAFTVEFHGKFIPLQGVPYIVRAAKLLEGEGVYFEIIGGGQTRGEAGRLAKELNVGNLAFTDRMPFEDLPEYIKKFDICLGIFGDTPKTQRVIPNKVFECLALRKPVITADTPAARELLTDKEDILFCRTADEKDLAEKIVLLRDDQELRGRIAAGGYQTFLRTSTPKVLGAELHATLEKLV